MRADSPTMATHVVSDLIQDWRSDARRSQNTRRAYEQGLSDFAGWLERGTLSAAVVLLSTVPGAGNALVERYASAMLGRGLSGSTVRVRVSALKSLLRAARKRGIISWGLDVDLPNPRKYRSRTIPTHEEYLAMLDIAGDRTKGARDRCIIRLLGECGLRESSVLTLRPEDLDLDSTPPVLWIMLKGREGRHRHPITDAARDDLRAWLSERGAHPGPLIGHWLDGEWSDISRQTLYRTVRKIGREAGKDVRPHDLRRYCGGRVWLATKSIEATQQYLGHANAATTRACYVEPLQELPEHVVSVLNDQNQEEDDGRH